MKADHRYVSTACNHLLHGRCPRLCEFCDALCACSCHEFDLPLPRRTKEN